MVSIVINNYNYGQFLRDAIDSALCQTCCAAEVIVVDDGSTDNSRDVILGYGDRIIPVLKTNGGQASALNAGFARSQGDVVIFLDADDVLAPDIVRRVREVLSANPDTAKVQYRMEVIDAQGTRMGTIRPARHLPLRSGDLRRHVLTFPFDMAWTATSGNAFARRVLGRIFPIPESDAGYSRVGADWYLSHLAPLFGPVISLDEVGAFYRVHGSNYYEMPAPEIDLSHVRQSIAYARHTRTYIKKYADQLGLSDRPAQANDILSVSFVANRLISLKLDRRHHPIGTDRIGRLVRLGVIASLRRFDVSLPMKMLFSLWFMAMACAPKPAARWLAVQFMFPEARGRFNAVLGSLHAAL